MLKINMIIVNIYQHKLYNINTTKGKIYMEENKGLPRVREGQMCTADIFFCVDT